MHKMPSVLLATSLALPLAACNGTKERTESQASPYAGRTLADLQAEYDRRNAEENKRCLYASFEQIKADQPWCEQDRKALAPLGNEIGARLAQQKP